MTTETNTVTGRFIENLALSAYDYIRGGKFMTGADRKLLSFEDSSLDEEDFAEGVVFDGKTNTTEFEFSVLFSGKPLSLSLVSGEPSELTPEHFSDFIVTTGISSAGSSSKIQKMKVPESVNTLTRNLETDGVYQAIYVISSRTLFLSWPAPQVREHCVAVFILSDDIIAKLQ